MWAGINFALESSKNVKQMPLSVQNFKGELLSDPQHIADNFSPAGKETIIKRLINVSQETIIKLSYVY